jgi:hypothetical protein
MLRRMPRSRTVPQTRRLERIKALASDLSRELVRTDSRCPSKKAMADQIWTDANAVLRALKRPKP